MWNIVPRVGIKVTYLAFWVNVLPCHHNTHAHLSMQLLASEVIAEYYTRPPRILSFVMLTIAYSQ